jgi:hypothetical protein
MSRRGAETDPKLTLGAGVALLAVGLWLLLGRPGLSGLGLTVAGGLLAGWALWQLVGSGR